MRMPATVKDALQNTLSKMVSLYPALSPTYLCRILVSLHPDLIYMHATGMALANNLGNVKGFDHSECPSKVKLQLDSIIE